MPVVDESLTEYRIELASFEDLARLTCAYKEYTEPLYVFEMDRKRVIANIQHLSNTRVVLHAPLPREGKYVSYKIDGTKEVCNVVDTAANIAVYAPIIYLKSRTIGDVELIGDMDNDMADMFHSSELSDLGSLTRLAHNPDSQEMQNLTLYAMPTGKKSGGGGSDDVNGDEKEKKEKKEGWVLGHLIHNGVEQFGLEFYYLRSDAEPDGRFVRYRTDFSSEPEFADIIETGYAYMPVIKLKKMYGLFGLMGRYD